MAYTPNYSADPTDADVAAFLTAAGLYSSQIQTFNLGFAAASVSAFQKNTGREPFLTGASAKFYFDPPGVQSKQQQGWWLGGEKWLELTPCFTSISDISLGADYDNPNGTTSLVIGQNVFLKPNNCLAMGLPIEYIKFQFNPVGMDQSIVITGTPGSYSAWPPDAFNAVVARAAADLSGAIGASISGGATAWGEADTKMTFTDNPMAQFELTWRRMFDVAVARYNRWTVGLT